MIYVAIRLSTDASLRYPIASRLEAHLPRLILNYRIVGLGWDFRDLHGIEAEIIDVIEIPRSEAKML
jgi:hypothetical protein